MLKNISYLVDILVKTRFNCLL